MHIQKNLINSIHKPLWVCLCVLRITYYHHYWKFNHSRWKFLEIVSLFFTSLNASLNLLFLQLLLLLYESTLNFFNKQQHSLPSGLFVFIIDSNLNQFKFDWLLSKYVNMMIENIICKCYFAIWFEFWMSIFYGYAENIVKGFMVAATTAVTCYYSHLYSRELKAFIFFPFMILMIMMRKFLMYQEKKQKILHHQMYCV